MGRKTERQSKRLIEEEIRKPTSTEEEMELYKNTTIALTLVSEDRIKL